MLNMLNKRVTLITDCNHQWTENQT